MRTLIIALGLSFIVNIAFAGNEVSCKVTCTNPATKTSKEYSCTYPMPPGVSFSQQDCANQCIQSCIGSFGLQSAGGKVPRKK